MKKEKVAILGASDKPERYSYLAFKKLLAHGHEPILISPTVKEVEGQKVYQSLSEIKEADTLTLYVNPQISSNMEKDILKLKPGRVIFNPGTENPELERALTKAGIPFEEACTLVLLNTGSF
jgi:uncharacterized protein